jgi:N6-adenosine-specific RNA methylase IME4
MGRPSIGKRAMTDAERQARRRELAQDRKRAPLLTKQALREAREAALAERVTALPDRRYGVILADPEWRFEVWNDTTGMDRAADNHYPTSELEVIKSRDVPSIAAADCVLFLWATVPMLSQAIEVMTAWGFTYKSGFVWLKNRIGTGYWNRNRHELLLVGTRGNVPAPAMGRQFDSVIESPVGRHSEKPDAAFPTLPKIELNARGARPGWAAGGTKQ